MPTSGASNTYSPVIREKSGSCEMSDRDAPVSPPPDRDGIGSNGVAIGFGSSPGEGDESPFPRDRGSSFSRSVVDQSTDDGILTPSADESVLEVDHLPTVVETDEAKVPESYPHGFIKLNTHDSSFVDEHIPSIDQFARDLQAAIDAAWPTRTRSRYKEVHVLLLSWEDDNLGVDREIKRLEYVFKNLYQFDVEEYKIPKKTPGKATTSRVSTFLEKDSCDNMLIVYYAGHARLCQQAGQPSIWAATDLVSSPTLPSGGVQQLLEEAASDVLLLYDSCYSTHPTINTSGQGVTEVIAACGFETHAPPVGPHSFTNALIRELEEAFTGPPISVAELHGRVIGSLKNWKPALLRDVDGNLWTDENGRPRYEFHKRRTPVHCFLTNEVPYRSIMLSPLTSKSSPNKLSTLESSIPRSISGSSASFSTADPSTQPTSISGSSLASEVRPQILLAVRLEEDYFLISDGEEGKLLRTWCNWLKTVPNGAEHITIEAVYKSCSTMLILSMPLIVWNLIPDNSAYSFIGFVKSPNLLQNRLAQAQAPSVDVRHTANPDVKELEREIRTRIKTEMAEKDLVRIQRDKAIAEEALAKLRKETEEARAKFRIEQEEAFAKAMMPNPFSNKKTREIPEVKPPIKFKDAVGRKFSFPFHLVATWAGVEELIRQAFLHVDILGPHVVEGHYDLISPTGEIVLPQVWETVVEPGWAVTMHMWPLPEPTKPAPPPGPPRHRVYPPGPPLPSPGSLPGMPPPPPPDFIGRPLEPTRPKPPPRPPRPRAYPPGPLPPPPDFIGRPPAPVQGIQIPAPFPTEPPVITVRSKNQKVKSKTKKPSPVIDKDEVIVVEEHDDRSASGSSVSGSDRDLSDFEDAMNMLNKLVKARRVYVVGSIGSVRKTVAHFNVGFNKDGVALLNECGRKLVEVQKLKNEKGDEVAKDKGNEEEEEDMLMDD